MALPSACRLITRASGTARAAPRARGGPLPMAPPVRVRCEKVGQPCGVLQIRDEEKGLMGGRMGGEQAGGMCRLGVEKNVLLVWCCAVVCRCDGVMA